MRGDLVRLPPIEAYGEAIAGLPHTPLRITVHALTPVVAIDGLQLDGVLAFGMKLATWGPAPFPTTQAPYWLPLPCAYTEVQGLPLWHITSFFPVSPHQDSTHYHKRTDANPYSFPAIMGTLQRKRPRRQPNTAAGQYMNYRIPEPYTVAECWQALCMGHQPEVERLLSYVSGLGKDLAQGYGRVQEWLVEPYDGPVTLTTAAGEVLRPIPTDDHTGILAAWTPPYWKRDLWLPCRVPLPSGPPWA